MATKEQLLRENITNKERLSQYTRKIENLEEELGKAQSNEKYYQDRFEDMKCQLHFLAGMLYKSGVELEWDRFVNRFDLVIKVDGKEKSKEKSIESFFNKS